MIAALALGALVGAGLADDQARPSAPAAIAVAEPIYDDLEALAARGILDLPDLYARPMVAFDIAERIEATLAEHPGLLEDPSFRRVYEAFADELDLFEHGEPPADHRSLISLANDENWLRVESAWRAQAESSADRGFVLTDSTRVGLRFSWMVWPGFHLFQEIYVANIENGSIYGDPLKPGTNVVIFQDRVYVGLHTRYTDIVFGRDRLGWGPGKTGSLMLSKTARPFTQLRLFRTFFDGRFHAVIVNGVLNQNEERYIAYHRLDWRIARNFRLGFAEGARYNAPGVEPLYLVGIIPYTIVERMLRRDNEDRLTDGVTRNNIMWSLDGTWQFLPGKQLYGELLIDDIGVEDVDHPTRIAYQLGGYAAGSLWGHELRARFEWTRVWAWVYSTFYDADFMHEGVPLGFPLGPDSRLIHANADWVINRGWSFGGTLERQDRGEGRIGQPWIPGEEQFRGLRASDFQGVVETQWRALGGFRHTPSAYLEAEAAIGPTWVRNANNVAGAKRAGMAGRLSLAYRY